MRVSPCCSSLCGTFFATGGVAAFGSSANTATGAVRSASAKAKRNRGMSGFLAARNEVRVSYPVQPSLSAGSLMPRRFRVGVVGFGVSGATTAYLLARDGHRVTLVERATEVGPIGAGVLLQCSGQEVLRHLGVLDHVLAHAAPIEELYAR